jgi:hypothetical protein
MNPPTIPTVRRIKRIAPLQLGKMLAILYGIIGLLVIPVFLVMASVGSQLPEGQRGAFMAMGAGAAIFAPIIYAVMGFIIGVIGAFIYNLVAKWVGGIEVEVE